MPRMASCVPVANGVLHPNGPSHIEVIPWLSAASQTFIPARIVTRLWLEGLRVCYREDPSLKPPQIAGWLAVRRLPEKKQMLAAALAVSNWMWMFTVNDGI